MTEPEERLRYEELLRYTEDLVRQHRVRECDVDDITQEVMYRFAAADGRDASEMPIQSSRGFLRGLVRYVICEYMRKCKRSPELTGDVQKFVSGSDSPDEVRCVQILWSRLTKQQWLVFMATCLSPPDDGDSGVTQEYVAKKLGISRRAVCRHIRHVKDEIQRLLEDLGIDFSNPNQHETDQSRKNNPEAAS